MTTLSIQVIHFIATLESNHSRLGESMPVSYQNSQTSKKIERNISKFLGYSVLSGHIIKDSCNFVVVSSSILNFLYECFLRLLLWIVSFPPMQSYGILCLASWTYWEWIFYASRKEMPTWNVSFNPTYVPIKHLHQGQIVGFCNFQKQPSRGVLRRKCCENVQQIYRRTLIPKCDFNKVAQQLYWNHTSVWVFFCKFVAYFQNT